MSFSKDLLGGVAQYLVNGGIGTWRPAAVYQPTDVDPFFIMSMPSTPDRVFVLTPYSVSDDGSLSDSVQGLQVRMRGTTDPNVVNDMSDAVFNRLHGAHSVALPGGVHLVMAQRRSGTPMGVDGNGRHERSDNYHLTVWRPSSHRI